MLGLFKWKVGVPTKDGEYLVMHRDHRGEIKIDHDFWIERANDWQSKWVEIVAWCCFEDIHTTCELR